jgi:hypothetical protein
MYKFKGTLLVRKIFEFDFALASTFSKSILLSSVIGSASVITSTGASSISSICILSSVYRRVIYHTDNLIVVLE